VNAGTVTVFPDDNKKNLSTDLLREKPVRENHATPAATCRNAGSVCIPTLHREADV